MASPNFDVRPGSYEAHLRRSVEANFRAVARAVAQREKTMASNTPPVIYLPGPKAKTNAIGVPLIRAALGGEE